jgi:hypothetical protein
VKRRASELFALTTPLHTVKTKINKIGLDWLRGLKDSNQPDNSIAGTMLANEYDKDKRETRKTESDIVESKSPDNSIAGTMSANELIM